MLLLCTAELLSLKLVNFEQDVVLTQEDINEDQLEGAMIFLRTAGPRIAGANRNYRISGGKGVLKLNYIIQHLQAIKEKGLVSPRLRFMIMDLFDLSLGNWKEKPLISEGNKETEVS